MAHRHGSRRAHDRRLLAVALALIVAFMAGEVAAAVVAGSLALLADAGHMLTDAAALVAALVASRLAVRPARGPWTFGLGRSEILAAQAYGIALLLIAALIVYGALRRLVSPRDVHGGVVLVVALAGVAVNLAATVVLARGERASLNIRGAYLHVATDLAAFVGTAVAGALILVTGWNRLDPIAALLVAALMVRSSWSLLRESGRIFLEASPEGIQPGAVAQAIAADPDVVEVHDLHVWTVTSGFPALSAHVLVEPDADCHAARRRLEQLLAERFGISHTTLQVEHAEPATTRVSLGDAVARRTPVERR
jgi:cobalt-zinc-cadmium efflux system protein